MNGHRRSRGKRRLERRREDDGSGERLRLFLFFFLTDGKGAQQRKRGRRLHLFFLLHAQKRGERRWDGVCARRGDFWDAGKCAFRC
jgi:hypothetical protein